VVGISADRVAAAHTAAALVRDRLGVELDPLLPVLRNVKPVLFYRAMFDRLDTGVPRNIEPGA
jgi:hypothetical protein